MKSGSLAPPRSASPAFGSPIRLEAALAEAEEEAAICGEIEVLIVATENPTGIPKKEKKKGKSKEQRESESEKEILGEKRKLKGAEEFPEKLVKHKSSRNALQPIDSNGALNLFLEQHQANFRLVEEPTELDTKSPSQRQFLRPPSPSRDSSSPLPEQPEGREKRVRKSINYAEPKLNTCAPFSLLF